MKKVLQALIVFLIAATSCEKMKEASAQGTLEFAEEIHELKTYFHIPGMAVFVQQGDYTLYEDYLGFSDLESQVAMDAETSIPMASLTKIFTGVLIQQLVDEGKLDLYDPINKYFDENIFEEEVTVAHVLSHSSQGSPGEQFYYSYRFGALTQVLEKASGQSFETLFQDRIFKKLGMEHSFLLENEAQIKESQIKMPKPYNWEGESKPGRIEYGYSSSAGLVSTVRDLAKFNQALDHYFLLPKESLNRMFTPLDSSLLYALGIFQQKIEGIQTYWGYGQYDSYSSLFLKIPEKNLTLIVAANNNLMSDPARLIYGDLSYSLFALSFMKNFVLDMEEISLLENEESIDHVTSRITKQNQSFYQKKILAQALSESFLARYEPERMVLSKKLLETAFSNFSDIEVNPDLSLLHGLSFLKTIDNKMELGGFEHFDRQIEEIGASLLKIDPNNPYANYYLGSYFDMKGVEKESRTYFQRILNAPNFSPFWYTQEAKSWIENHPQP